MSAQLENLKTQPLLRPESLFNNRTAIVEGWYPICKSTALGAGQAKSFVILNQRFVIWRGHDCDLRSIDAFCPHMGADLGNGQVIGNEIQCYFHRWQLNGQGEVTKTCSKKEAGGRYSNSYPVRDHLGQIWVYAGDKVRSPLILPPGIESSSVHSVQFGDFELFVHHHVMFAGGLDLQHFASVHNIEIEFDAEHTNRGDHVFDWKISGAIENKTWRGRVGRFFLGPRFTYTARLGAGSMMAISYGENRKLHAVWGCVPQKSGVSRVKAFSVVPKRSGALGKIKMWGQHLATLMLLLILKDDDSKACPNMRFQVSQPMAEDKTVLQLINVVNHMPESMWTKSAQTKFVNSALNIGL